MIRSQIPRFRLPESVIDEEVGYITRPRHRVPRLGKRIDSLKALLAEGYDAIFVGSGAPRGRDLDIPGREEAAANIHIGIDWLSSRSRSATSTRSASASSCSAAATPPWTAAAPRAASAARTSRSIVRSGFEEMKASPWEKEDAMHEDIPILNFLVPKEFTHENGKLTGVLFEKVKAELRRQGPPQAGPDRRAGRALSTATTCWSRSARRTPSPGSSATSASSSTSGTCRWSTR